MLMGLLPNPHSREILNMNHNGALFSQWLSLVLKHVFPQPKRVAKGTAPHGLRRPSPGIAPFVARPNSRQVRPNDGA